MGWVHVEALRRIGVPVLGIAGSSTDKARAAAARLELPRAYGSYQEVLDDHRVAVIHVCTPNRVHFEMTRDALLAGKHVMCEKPLAINSRQSAELVDLAARLPNQVAAVNYNIRFYPLCQEARQRIAAGDLGSLFHVAGSYVQDWLLLPTDYNWRVLAESGGSLRAVADIGTHWLDLASHITGLPVVAVCADLQTVHAERTRPQGEVATFAGGQSQAAGGAQVAIQTEDYGGILLELAGGVRGAVWVSQVTAGRKNSLRIEIAGQRQALAWESESPDELWIGHRDRANQRAGRDPGLLTELARGIADYPGGHVEGYADTFKQCFRTFYRCVRQPELLAGSPLATIADGHREMQLCEAVLKSHRERRWVQLSEVSP